MRRRMFLALFLCLAMMLPFGGVLAETAESGELPLTTEPVTISYWVPLHTNAAKVLTSWNDNDCFKELEKRTGVHVEFVHPPIGQEKEKYNLMVAARDLTDIVSYNYPDGPDKAFAEGIYRPVEDLVEKYCPNMTKILEEFPEARKQMTTNEGHIWGWGAFNLREDYEPYSGSPWAGPAVREDYLEQLGMEMPVTIEDWEAVLTAFRDELNLQVPFILDKNGQNIPFLGAFGVSNTYYRDADQKVKYGPMEPGYKEYLTLMNKWYNEGFLDPDFAATSSDSNFYSEYLTTGKAGAIAQTYQDIVPLYNSLLNGEGNVRATLYPRQTEDETVHFAVRSYEVEGESRDYLTTSCPEEKYEILCKWRDYWYSDEGTMLFNYGIEGKSYNMVDGEPVYTDLLDNNDYAIYSWQYKLFCHGYRYNPYAKPQSQIDASWASISQWYENNEMDYQMPNVSVPMEFASEFSTINTEIETYRDQMVLKFIMGVEPLDNFDRFVEELKALNVERAIELKQQALDLYNSH